MDAYCCERFETFARANGITPSGKYRWGFTDAKTGHVIEWFNYCPFCGVKTGELKGGGLSDITQRR